MSPPLASVARWAAASIPYVLLPLCGVLQLRGLSTCEYPKMGWSLHHHDSRLDAAVQSFAAANLSPEITARIRSVRESRFEGQPFVLDADGYPDRTVNAFFGSRRFRGYAATTQTRYALSIRLWLDFCEAVNVRWVDASPETVSDFKYWRMTDSNNPSRVAGSAFHTDLAAVSALYEWCDARFSLQNPVLRREFIRRGPTYGNSNLNGGQRALAEPAGVRDRNVKWLEPAAVRRWINVGLRGLTITGEEPAYSRNRTGTRDAAFAELLYGSGLRVSEAASLLLAELPNTKDAQRLYRSGELAAACAKGGAHRRWWCSRDALGDVEVYVEGQRAESVRRAQALGRYEQLDRVIEVRVDPTTRRIFGVEGGNQMSLDTLDARTRLRLFQRTERGLEPLALWLNESGLPRTAHSWQSTFRTGNERTTRASYPDFICTPHMLRHSFALRWYSVGRLIWDRRLVGLTDDEQCDYRQQFGDTWTFVQMLLGHRHPQTTANIYLEPFRALEVELLLEYAAEVPLPALMQVMASRDQRIVLDPVAQDARG